MSAPTDRRCFRARIRRGTSLVELLVALPLLGLVGAVAVTLLLAAHRSARQADGTLTTSHELRHGLLVIAGELQPLSAADVIAWSDTSLEYRSLVGAGTTCDAGLHTSGARDVHLLPPYDRERGRHPARASFVHAPADGDEVALELAPLLPSLTPTRFVSRLTGVGTSGACADAAARTMPGRAVHLTFADPLPATPLEGGVVRLSRRARLSLYRAGDGHWYVGRRAARPDGTFDVIQPVVGPMLSAGQRGLRIVVRDTTANDVRRALVTIALRAARPGAGGVTQIDSTGIAIALRRTVRP